MFVSLLDLEPDGFMEGGAHGTPAWRAGNLDHEADVDERVDVINCSLESLMSNSKMWDIDIYIVSVEG